MKFPLILHCCNLATVMIGNMFLEIEIHQRVATQRLSTAGLDASSGYQEVPLSSDKYLDKYSELCSAFFF